MRILHLRFSNLNSLQGEWAIDFEHPDYQADGIFAIIGPTGSGKSTLLDAICLALYGQTPRLGKVTKSQNEIMSRQAGECFAEVVFQTQAGRYCSHWSQKRAKGQSQGSLQPPQHEISETASKKVLASKLRDVGSQIQQLTGMDFEQFTRSMLLAQGSFAAFLQASPDQRSPILEQITGTQIYSAISLATHERKSQEAKVYENLQAGQAHLELMEPDEEIQAQTELTALRQQIEVISQQERHNQELIQQLKRYQELQAEQDDLQSQEIAWQASQTAFVPQRQLLEQARLAQTLMLDYHRLTDARDQSETQSRLLEQYQTGQAELLMGHAQQQEISVQSLQALTEAQTRQIAKQPLIEQAKGLDQRLQALRQTLQDWEQEHQQNVQNQQSQSQEAERNQAEQVRCAASLEEVTNALESHSADQHLSEQLPLIQKTLNQLRQQQALEQAQSLVKAQAESEQLKAELNNKTQALTGFQTRLDHIRQSVRETEQAQQAYLEGQRPVELEQALATQQGLRQTLQAAIVSKQILQDCAQSRSEAQAAIARLQQDLSEQAHQTQLNDQALELAKGQIAACQREISLQAQIKSLEEERDRLIAGKPCPLCGSESHPYRVDAPRLDSALESQLKTFNADYESAQETHLQLRLQVSAHEQEIAQHSNAAQGAQEKQELETARFIKHCEQVQLSEDSELETLQANLTQAEQALDAAETRLKALRQLQEQLQTLNQDLNQQQEDFQRFSSEYQRIQAAYQQAENATQQQARQQAATQEAVQAGFSELTELLAPFQIDPAQQDLDALMDRLRADDLQWESWSTRRDQYQTELAVLLERTKNGAENLLQAQDKQARSLSKVMQQQALYQQCSAERLACFGEDDPEQVSKQLQANCESAEQHHRRQLEALQACQEALQAYQVQKTSLETTLAQSRAKQSDLEQGFQRQRESLRFTTEPDYLAACLSPEQITELERAAASLEQQETERQAAAKRNQQQFEQVLSQIQDGQVGQNLGALMQAQQSREAQKQLLAIQQGAIQQRLEHNATLKSQSLAELDKIKAQWTELSRWQALHDLIGSSSGKKFRNFAQGLTFDVMIYYANQHLQKMSRRYLLRRESADSLDLSIVDSFQGGEIRSTKNLSGGESFIVSLALALGLSQMASQNVRVDSLFLDEGFGTLDQEALDVALETLASLQQENKLIGIISHVQALKERMATQIRLISHNNGTSRLKGPGCSQKAH